MCSCVSVLDQLLSYDIFSLWWQEREDQLRTKQGGLSKDSEETDSGLLWLVINAFMQCVAEYRSTGEESG